MKSSLYVFFLIIAFTGLSCKKVFHGEGKTRVKGQVVDKFSGDPIPGAWVEILAQGDDSWYAPYIIDSIPTDHEGKFDHTFDAQKGVNYFALGSYHKLYANYDDLMVDLKDGWGNKKLKLELHPLAWVKANFINISPFDTVSSLHCNAFRDHPSAIFTTSKDTFQLGKTLSNTSLDLPCFIVKGQNQERTNFDINIAPFDTLEIFVEY